jgi:hypothetical protein
MSSTCVRMSRWALAPVQQMQKISESRDGNEQT